ncbi:MFS general substrate transporter [Nemania sp. NC0429]|nr:MFS general substrate transporter [Nemania sp. NC0429]
MQSVGLTSKHGEEQLQMQDQPVEAQSPPTPVMIETIDTPPAPKAKKPFSFYMSVLMLCLLAVITAWDATSLAIALPSITEQLHGTTLESFWASTAFILGVAITQPIYVSVSDVLGRKGPLYGSMVLFAAGSIVFAVAPNMAALIAGRVIQGFGAGGLDVLEEMILADITSLKERPLYLAMIALAIATGSIAGPLLGAVFSEFDWRWIGWINLPIVGTAFVLSIAFLHLRPIRTPLAVKIRRIDWTGIALFTVGASATSVPISWADTLYPWSSWRTILPLVIGVAVLAILGVYEAKRKSPDSILPRRIFSSITSVSSLVCGFLHGLILYTGLLYLPLFFQAIRLEKALDAAKSTLPLAFLVVAFSFLAPVTIEITRRYRILLWVGWALMTASMGAWSLIGRETSRATTYAVEAVLGIGIGIVFTGTQVPMQASVVHVDDTGLAVGMLVVFRLFGALIGLAVSSTAFISVFQENIALHSPLPEQLRDLNDATQAIAFLPTLRTLNLTGETLDEVISTYDKSFKAVWYILASFGVLGFISSLFTKELSLESEEVGRQGFEHST